jgi:membrane fusion protein, copper/silver efflux system
MNRAIYVPTVFLLVFVSFVSGALWSRRGTPAGASVERKALYYSCPMHPQYKSDRPGDCPSCGMRLEPVYADGGSGPTARGDGHSLPAGTVQVSHERQQTIGVRLGVVERVSGTRNLRTTGRVAPIENAVYPLVSGADGQVREVYGATTGSLVKKNEVLLTFYAPEFLTAQQSYYSGLDTLGRTTTNEQLVGYNQSRVVDGVERFANTLRNLGVSEQQLSEMRTKRQISQYIQIVSPVDGFVLDRNASVGLRVDRGFEFYRIADLRQVWILADVYENQAPFIRSGSRARITAQDQTRQLDGAVSRSEPTFDETTRTLKVRIETDNPGLALKPGMFVDVQFAIDLPESLAVPADAIVDSGLRKTVFVDRGNGYFEPRQVATGWRIADQVEIVKGLMAGERIVIAGTFLIDSESRMKAAAAGIFTTAAKDVVCGMDVDETKAVAAGRTSAHDGHTYFFCSDECKKKFEANPARYAEPHDHAPAKASAAANPPTSGMPATKGGVPAAAATVKDVVCGMDIDPNGAAGQVEYEGKTYFFCSNDCKQRFEKSPKQYIK